MERISECINGDKKAFVEKEGFLYQVTMYEGSVEQATLKVISLQEAENLAEDFVSTSSPKTLLNG